MDDPGRPVTLPGQTDADGSGEEAGDSDPSEDAAPPVRHGSLQQTLQQAAQRARSKETAQSKETPKETEEEVSSDVTPAPARSSLQRSQTLAQAAMRARSKESAPADVGERSRDDAMPAATELAPLELAAEPPPLAETRSSQVALQSRQEAALRAQASAQATALRASAQGADQVAVRDPHEMVAHPHSQDRPTSAGIESDAFSESNTPSSAESQPRLRLALFPGITEDHVKQAFDELDYDQNGYLGAGELRYMLMLQGEKPTDEEIDEMLRMLECTEDGVVDYEEFRMLLGPGSLVPEEMLALLATSDSPEKRQQEEHLAMLKAKEEAGPTTRHMDRLLAGSSAFQNVWTKKKRDAERQATLPSTKPIKRGAIRARPEQPKPPLPLSPNQSRKMRLAMADSTKPKAKAKGAGKGAGKEKGAAEGLHYIPPSLQKQNESQSPERQGSKQSSSGAQSSNKN